MKFTVSHADESDYTHDGLRAFFEYRDLGIKEATAGQFSAHVIRVGRERKPLKNGTGTTSTSKRSTCCEAGCGSSTRALARCCSGRDRASISRQASSTARSSIPMTWKCWKSRLPPSSGRRRRRGGFVRVLARQSPAQEMMRQVQPSRPCILLAMLATVK